MEAREKILYSFFLLFMFGLLAGSQAQAQTLSVGRSTAICSPGDQPETGMQGETPLQDIQSGRSKAPYSCGMRIVGHTNIWNRGDNLQVVRSRSCAYVSSTFGKTQYAGVAVIDVSDPTAPKPLGLLSEPGAIHAVETIDAIDVGDRHILVAGAYGGGLNPPGPAPLDIYDITDCTKPKHMATYYWPANVHIPKISPDGKRVYASRAAGVAGVYVLDITDLSSPKFLGDFPLMLPDGRQVRCHDIEFNDDETRMYCPGSVPTPEKKEAESGPYIWDVSQISSGKQKPSWPVIPFVGEADIKGQGDHHTPRAMINGKPYLIAANELGFTAYPRIFDISDERAPRMVSEFKLEVTDRGATDPAWAKENSLGNYGLHYNSVVDNAWGDKVLGLFSFMGSGVRIVDLRDPLKPREIAYYKPGGTTTKTTPFGPAVGTPDEVSSHQIFIHETGHIWFVSQTLGFYVAELSPAVRAYLGVGSDAKP